MPSRFGNQLRKVREKRKFTQQKLANAIGVLSVTVSRWERGDHKPDVDDLRSICLALNADANVILRLPRRRREPVTPKVVPVEPVDAA